MLLRGMDLFKDSYMIKKELSDLYLLQGNTEAAIKATTIKKHKKIQNDDSEYSPSESDDVSDDSLENEFDDLIHLKISARKNFKASTSKLSLEQVQRKLIKLRTEIYDDYDHGKIMLNFERAKLLYDTYDENSKESDDTMHEFVNTLGPTLIKIVSRHAKIDEYSKLLKLEHNLKFKSSDNLQDLDQSSEPLDTEKPLFFQNQSLYKNLESERLK